jgi:hypothetical protein
MHLRLVPPEGSAVVRPAWLRMDPLSRFFIVQSANRIFLARRPRFARVVATGRLSRVTDRQACCLIGPPEPRPLKEVSNEPTGKTLCWRHDRQGDHGAPSPDAHAHGDGPPDAHQALSPLPRPEEHGQTPLGQEQHTAQPAGRRPPLPSSPGDDQNIAQARLRGGAARGAAFLRGVVQGARRRRAERIHPLPHVIAPGRSGDGARMPRHRPHRRR